MEDLLIIAWNIWILIIVYKLLVLDRNTWNYNCVNKLL